MKTISRRASIAGLAAVSGLAGIGYSCYQYRLVQPSDAGLTALWDLELEQPLGGTLKLKSFRGKPLVLNFWATWCPPCVAELPLLERFYQQNAAKGWQVVGLAVDNTKSVTQFLSKIPLSFPTPLAGFEGTELSRSLGNVSGGLPFTVVFNSIGEVALRHMGQLSAEQLTSFLAIH